MRGDREADAGAPPGRRVETVYALLRRAILEQALEPGTRLPEDKVGEQTGVSRTVVRAALARLAAEGLVELRPNRTASVAAPSVEEAREVFAVRAWLERAVVRELAARIGPRELRRLEEHVAREERAAAAAGPQAVRLAGEFHLLLAGLAGNRLLERYVTETVSRCSLILARFGLPHSRDCGVSEHRALIEALGRHDADAAERLMVEHLEAIQARADLAAGDGADALGRALARYARSIP